MAKPVVASPAAASGLDDVLSGEISVADTPEAMAAVVTAVLTGVSEAPNGLAARERVIESYSWERNLQVLDRLISG